LRQVMLYRDLKAGVRLGSDEAGSRTLWLLTCEARQKT